MRLTVAFFHSTKSLFSIYALEKRRGCRVLRTGIFFGLGHRCKDGEDGDLSELLKSANDWNDKRMKMDQENNSLRLGASARLQRAQEQALLVHQIVLVASIQLRDIDKFKNFVYFIRETKTNHAFTTFITSHLASEESMTKTPPPGLESTQVRISSKREAGGRANTRLQNEQFIHKR